MSRPPAPVARRGLAARAGVAAVVVAIAVACAAAWQWFQERPLRDAERELARGNAPRALALAEYYLDLQPGSGRAAAARARALAALGRADEAIAVYESVGGATPDDLHAWARAHLLREQWSRASPLLGQVVRLRPDDADALYELATCLTRLGRLTEAAEIAARFAALPGQKARGDLLQGAILADAGKTEESALAYARVLAVSPDGDGLQVPPEEFFEQYATILMNQGKADEAIPLLERSISLRPTAAACHLLGKALARGGDEAGAAARWQAAIDLDPAAVSPREDLAAAAIARGDADEARKWLDSLAPVADRRSQTAYLEQRLAAITKDDEAFARWKAKADELRALEGRITVLEQMMAGSPESYWSQVVRAHKFATLGNWRQAADMLAMIAPEPDENAFVVGLREAVRTRGELPSLDGVPIEVR